MGSGCEGNNSDEIGRRLTILTESIVDFRVKWNRDVIVFRLIGGILGYIHVDAAVSALGDNMFVFL